jgi:hypothetical protein
LPINRDSTQHWPALCSCFASLDLLFCSRSRLVRHLAAACTRMPPTVATTDCPQRRGFVPAQVQDPVVATLQLQQRAATSDIADCLSVAMFYLPCTPPPDACEHAMWKAALCMYIVCCMRVHIRMLARGWDEGRTKRLDSVCNEPVILAATHIRPGYKSPRHQQACVMLCCHHKHAFCCLLAMRVSCPNRK